MIHPLVSIIITIYKVEPYLSRCLDSILNQTYTNLEIILVDDGSPDACPQICDEYAAKDKRIVVIHKENGGLSDARNAGLDICKGEYISFVDSDDWVDDKYIEELIKPNSKNQYDIVIADYQQSNEPFDSRHILLKAGSLNGNHKIISAYCHLQYPPCAWAKLYNAAFIKENQLKFCKGILYEDQLWSCQQAVLAKQIFILSNKIYYYTIRDNSIMRSNNMPFEKHITSWKIILSNEKKLLNQCSNIKSKDIDYFFLQKTSEILNNPHNNWDYFKKSFLTIAESLNKNPIGYWLKFSTYPKKIIFFLLNKAPQIASQIVLYYYFKK